jgi:hypothetical protein
MSAAPKLAGFAVVLVILFGIAALAGGASGPLHKQTTAAKQQGGEGMTAMDGADGVTATVNYATEKAPGRVRPGHGGRRAARRGH